MTVCDTTAYDWSLPFANASKFKDAIDNAQEQCKTSFADLTGRATGALAERSQSSQEYSLSFVYEHDNGEDSTIFTPGKVQAMCKIESTVTEHPLYKAFCQLDAGKNCVAQILSPVTKFYPNPDDRALSKGGCKLLDAAFVEATAKGMMNNFLTTSNGFFANEAAVDGGYTNATRSMLQLGQPLAGYENEDDDKQKQRLIYLKFFDGYNCPIDYDEDEKYTGPDLCTGVADGGYVKGLEQSLFDLFEMSGFPSSGNFKYAFKSPYYTIPVYDVPNEDKLRARFYGGVTQSLEFARVVSGDLNFAIISIICVYCYLWFHTRSAMIASTSMLSIVLSLPVGYFFYFNIFQYHYYQQIHILTIFLALGIGADSVFVIVDAWKEASHHPHIKTSVGRLNYAITRCAKSCFNTTFTTVMSFVATCLTPILPIHTFAVFAAIVMTINYVLVVIFTPAMIIIYHVLFSDKGGFCCYCVKGKNMCRWKEDVTPDTVGMRNADKLYKCLNSKKEELPAPVAMSAQSVGVVGVVGADGKETLPEATVVSHGSSSDESEETLSSELGRIQHFMYTKYSPFLGCKEPFKKFKPFAILCIIALIAYWCGMLYAAAQLTPPKTEELWFPASHMMNLEFYDRLQNGWKGGAASLFMDATIAFGMHDMMRDEYNWFFPALNRGEVRWDESFDLTKPEQQVFFMKVCDTVKNQDCTELPCKGGKLMRAGAEPTCVVRDMLSYYNNVYNGGEGNADGVADSFVPGDKLLAVYDAFMTDVAPFGGSVGLLAAHQQKYRSVIGTKDGKIVFAKVDFKMSADADGLSNAKGHVLFDILKGMTDKLRAEAPDGMKSMFFIDLERQGNGFTWMDVEDALVANLFNGFAVCFPVAFVVLILATGNILLAFYATFSIAMIVVGVLGAVQAYHGWDLGIAESIAGVIVIGFSVDYTVHLGHMYIEAADLPTREEKTRFALTHMGGTVIGGGMTTMIAGLVLFLCTLQFFTKMATLLVWTIVLSMIYALIFFMALCAVGGPTDQWGDISVILKPCLAWGRKKRWIPSSQA